jgi:hypothetical protein
MNMDDIFSQFEIFSVAPLVVAAVEAVAAVNAERKQPTNQSEIDSEEVAMVLRKK